MANSNLFDHEHSEGCTQLQSGGRKFKMFALFRHCLYSKASFHFFAKSANGHNLREMIDYNGFKEMNSQVEYGNDSDVFL